MRITFVQYGDFFEAAQRFDAGGDETYAAQRYSVNLVRDLKREFEDVCVICLAESYSERVLPDGVRTLGLRLYHDGDEDSLTQLVAQQRPTHLVPRSPLVKLLRWSAAHGVTTLPLLATSFPRGYLRSWIGQRRVARALNSPHIPWVGNHSTNSANDLRRIGVDPNRIIPWDWPPAARPSDWPAKRGPRSSGCFRIFYAGRVQETKGVGECIRAIGVLRGKGLPAELTIAGAGELDRYRAFAAENDLGDAVRLLGRIAHRDVIRLMHEHDVVVVPSQHAYPEGLPMTIYDAYASRSPLVASDHPMFRAKVRDGEAALIFPAEDHVALAERLERLASDPNLYAKLSEASAHSWERLQLPVKWGELLQRWLRNSPDDRDWLSGHSLASGLYSC
jgi:glycosyltransferase involved in cell wall biosynthesis